MGAIQRYCNKVIYVKDGILEKSENLQDITNKYSEDNLETFENQTVSSKKNKQDKAKIWIEKQSNSIISDSSETFDFDICYDIFDEALKDEENIREMVAFPLGANGADAMMGCPGEVFEKQLRETHIKIRD